MEKAGSTTTSSVDNSSQKNETPITLIPVVTTTNNNNISNTKSASSSISELRLKLQQRITDLQIKRRAMPTNPPLNAASAATGANADRAPRSRQEILDRRLKRKDARKQKKNGGNSVKAAEGELTTVGVKRKDCMSDTDAIAAQQKKSEMVVKDNVSFGTIQFSMGDALTGMSADAAGGRANKKHKKGPTDTIGQINKVKVGKYKK